MADIGTSLPVTLPEAVPSSTPVGSEEAGRHLAAQTMTVVRHFGKQLPSIRIKKPEQASCIDGIQQTTRLRDGLTSDLRYMAMGDDRGYHRSRQGFKPANLTCAGKKRVTERPFITRDRLCRGQGSPDALPEIGGDPVIRQNILTNVLLPLVPPLLQNTGKTSTQQIGLDLVEHFGGHRDEFAENGGLPEQHFTGHEQRCYPWKGG